MQDQYQEIIDQLRDLSTHGLRYTEAKLVAMAIESLVIAQILNTED